MAGTVQKNGGNIIGITMEIIKQNARKNADEMVISQDLSERQKMMFERSDALVTLPGGIGTLNEISAALELKKHKTYEKPIVVLNTDNFYEGLKVQFQKMKDDEFLPRPIDEVIYFADTPSEAMEYINK